VKEQGRTSAAGDPLIDKALSATAHVKAHAATVVADLKLKAATIDLLIKQRKGAATEKAQEAVTSKSPAQLKELLSKREARIAQLEKQIASGGGACRPGGSSWKKKKSGIPRDGPVSFDINFEEAPKTRLCRAGVDFGNSRARSMFCRIIDEGARRIKKYGDNKSYEFQQKYPELDICPSSAHEIRALGHGGYKKENYEVPLIKTNSTFNEGSKRFPEALAQTIKNQNVFTALNEIVCLGRCAIPPKWARGTNNGLLVRDGYCKCYDGVQTALYSDMDNRFSNWDVLNVASVLSENAQRYLCGRVPVAGCKFCAVGFSPKDKTSWMAELLIPKIFPKDARNDDKVWVPAKMEALGSCPKWWDAYRDSSRWKGDKTKEWRKKGGDVKCKPHTGVKGSPDYETEELLQLKAGDRLQDASHASWKMKAKTFKIKKKFKIKKPTFKAMKKLAGGLRKTLSPTGIILAAAKKIVRVVVPTLPCLTRKNRNRINALMDVVIDDYIKHSVNPVNTLKKELLAVCKKSDNDFKRRVMPHKNLTERPCGATQSGMLAELIPNQVICLLSGTTLLSTTVSMNNYAEPAQQYQQFCERLDAMNPFTGLPRKDQRGKMKHREATKATLSFGEGRVSGQGGLRLFPHLPGKKAYSKCSPKAPCTHKELQQLSRKFLEENGLWSPSAKEEPGLPKVDKMGRSPSLVARSQYVNNVVDPTWSVMFLRAETAYGTRSMGSTKSTKTTTKSNLGAQEVVYQ